MNSKSLFLLILILSCSVANYSQDKPVAKVGNRQISYSEFRDRYEFTPWNKEIRSLPGEESKKEFLYTLIAEKLFSQKASELGYDTTLAFLTKIKVLEKMYTRDALYRAEILKYVQVSDEELNDAYLKIHKKLYGKFISSIEYAGIERLSRILASGTDFDSLYNTMPLELRDTLVINFGKFNKELEDSLYTLKSGEFSSPLLFGDNWFIVKIEEIVSTAPKTEREENVLLNEAEKIVTARKSSVYYKKYLDSFLSDKKTDVNGKIYQVIAAEIISLIGEKWRSQSDSSKVYLSETDFNNIRTKLGAQILNTPIIKSGELSSTVSDFLDNIVYNENTYNTDNPDVIKGALSKVLLDFMRNELLAAEGYRKGLHLTDEVKNQVQIWRDNYLFDMLKSIVLDSSRVNDKDIYEYYNQRSEYSKSHRIKITEVVTGNLDDIEKVLSENKSGTSIKQLAEKYTDKKLKRFVNGESGYLPADSLEELGRIALTMNEGDIYGPLKIEGGYSVFQLVDKKESKEEILPFETVRSELKKTLEGLRKYHALVNYTAALAGEYNFSIDEKILSSVEVTNIYSIMFRNMGFGGRILAAPMIAPYSEWVDQLKIFKITP